MNKLICITAKNKNVSMTQALDNGQVEVRLQGKKLKGGYALVRTDSGKKERWLLIKMKDDEADARRNPTSTEPKSALTGRTLKEIAKDESNSDKDSDNTKDS